MNCIFDRGIAPLRNNFVNASAEFYGLKGDVDMSMEDKVREIETELSAEMIEELAARADTMGLTADEYAGCVIGQHICNEREKEPA